MAVRTCFFFPVLKESETEFDNFDPLHKQYFNKPVKDCDFADRQQNLIILYDVSKIPFIFKWLQI